MDVVDYQPKRRGPRMAPHGTPHVTLSSHELVSSKLLFACISTTTATITTTNTTTSYNSANIANTMTTTTIITSTTEQIKTEIVAYSLHNIFFKNQS